MGSRDSGVVRFSFDMRSLKTDLSAKLHQKIGPLSQNTELKNNLARIAEHIIYPYVPMSEKPPTRHHLNRASISDGRITWYRESQGKEIADDLFYGPIRGHWKKRYAGHKPRSEWTSALYQVGNWKRFVNDSKELVIKEIHHNG